MSVKVKICGLTRAEDALAAAEAGADFLGFIQYDRSPRFVDPRRAAEIAAAAKAAHPTVLAVGVFVNEKMEKILSLLQDQVFDYAQLSGDESSGALDLLDGRGFRAIRPTSEAEAVRQASEFGRRSVQPALLLDAHVPGLYGGTGAQADFQVAARLARDWDLMLAGGLNPDNVAGAIRTVRPWAVDVSSGVEVSPGIKDPARLKLFIRSVKYPDN